MTRWLNSRLTINKHMNSSWFCIFLLPSDNNLHKIYEQITKTSLSIIPFLLVYAFMF